MSMLLVVRHGEAEGNAMHRFIGQSDVSLTDHGHTQAEALASRLERLDVARIVSSDLSRSISTVTPLADRLGVEVEADPRLREIDNGLWTGLLPDEIAEGWPEMWADYVSGVDVARPEGETWHEVSERVVGVARDALAADSTVVLGTHGGPALILALWASGMEAEGNVFRSRLGSLDNASLTVIDGGPRLITYNDTGHLGELPELSLPFEP